MQKFEVGKTYTCRAACNYDTVYSYKVTKRTAKTITIVEHGEKPKRVKIFTNDEGEYALPNGRYSMCPIIRA